MRWGCLLLLLLIAALGLGSAWWVRQHPEFNPYAPLSLGERPGWVAGRKLVRLGRTPALCRTLLAKEGLAVTALPPVGEGECRLADRTVLGSLDTLGTRLRPARAPATCAVDAGLVLWLRHSVQPAAVGFFGEQVVAIQHYGTDNCRRVGGAGGNWSEHATGNAIDVAAFLLASGRRIRVQSGWEGPVDEAAFLRRVRDEACGAFGTVLSPDYNQAHADHFHLDQAAWREWQGFCR